MTNRPVPTVPDTPSASNGAGPAPEGVGRKAPRQPKLESIINALSIKLGEKIDQITQLENREIYLSSVITDVESELEDASSVIKRQRREIAFLREKAGIGPNDPLDLPEDDED